MPSSLLQLEDARLQRKDLLFLLKVGVLTLCSIRGEQVGSALRGHGTGAQRFSRPVWKGKTPSVMTTSLKYKTVPLVLLSSTAREVLGEEPPLVGIIARLEKPACVVGAEPERLTLTLANSLALQGPGDWKNWPASGVLPLYQPLGSCSSPGWWPIKQPV